MFFASALQKVRNHTIDFPTGIIHLKYPQSRTTVIVRGIESQEQVLRDLLIDFSDFLLSSQKGLIYIKFKDEKAMMQAYEILLKAHNSQDSIKYEISIQEPTISQLYYELKSKVSYRKASFEEEEQKQVDFYSMMQMGLMPQPQPGEKQQ